MHRNVKLNQIFIRLWFCRDGYFLLAEMAKTENNSSSMWQSKQIT